MFSQEDFTKHCKLVTQNAWRQDGSGGTTLNSMVEYIVRESLSTVIEVIIEHEAKIQELEEQVYYLTHKEQPEGRVVAPEQRKHLDGKNGGVSQPQRDTKSTTSRAGSWTWNARDGK